MEVLPLKNDEPEEFLSGFVPERDLTGGFAMNADVSDKIDACIEAIEGIFRSGKTVVSLTSFGKDSSILAQCAVIALQNEIRNGNHNAELIIANAEVGGSESPIMAEFVGNSLRKVEEYAEKHSLPIKVISERPNWSENYLLQLMCGRAGVVFAGQSRTCSQDMKKAPVDRLIATLDKQYPNKISVSGMYFAESPSRRERMIERGDRPDQVRVDSDGSEHLVPMAGFNANEVIDLVARLSVTSFGIPCEFGSHTVTEAVVDFGAVASIYTDASASACSVEAMADDGVKGTSGCGDARTGCHLCTAISKDTSAMNIAKNTGNKTVEKLLEVRDVLKATQYKMESRTWLCELLHLNR